MKGILVIIDGLGDRACEELGDKTPLEAAETPNLDFISEKSQLGFMYPVTETFTPESDKAVISILGSKNFPARGEMEVLGAGISLEKGNLALRANFGTIQDLKSKKVIDRRVGRTLTTKEASELAKAINEKVKLPCKFIFKNTVQYRGVLVFKGGFSDNVTNTDPAYQEKGKYRYSETFKFSEPLDEEANTKYTANLINSFVEQSAKILNEHPINKKRIQKNLMPANVIFLRDAGTQPPSFIKFMRWACITNMPLETGIGKSFGMKVFSFPYPELKNSDAYQNLNCALKKMCEFAKKIIKKEAKNFSYFYIHFKETDTPGHDGKPKEKKEMIELLDKEFFPFLKEIIEKDKIKILVTADHSTPCSLKSHSADPVPVLFYGNKEDGFKFSEPASRKGSFGKLYGIELLKKAKFD